MEEQQQHQQQSSPGVAPVQLKDCIQELFSFVLSSTIDQTIQVDIGLPKDYCSKLLQEDPRYPSPIFTDFSQGVPSYPLYKHLAAALCHSISSGVVSRMDNKITLINEDSSLERKENEWNELILDKGSKLVNMLKVVNFELHVQEPFFSQLKDGKKTVEGRCASGDYNRVESGALVLFNKCLMLQVQEVHRYASFCEMLEAESLAKVLPGVKTIEEGVQIYRKFYSEEREKLNGVLAICVKQPVIQLYNSLAFILLGLSYEGIQRLLGLVHTTGTILEVLPPSRSALLSSFLLPHNPNVKGSTLTDGARALAKHANRSSSKYWGNISGSDSSKNQLALDVISRLIDHCCWRNIHIIPQHGVVFEIRATTGYGARWSGDGSKFIGFLEPYTEDGHSKG